tara:strand:+ start:931 stop:1548 length:618 start_codon:yes stop_codon:yes gene_type:complete
MYTTNHDLTIQEHKYLQDIDYLASLTRDPQEEVLHEIDCIQSSFEEKQALHELVLTHISHLGLQTEWINEEINVGSAKDFDNFEYYSQLLDEAEMDMDMELFEDEQKCHELLSLNQWEKRELYPSTMALTKDSRFVAWARIAHIGNKYSTGDSDYGRVYIPNELLGNTLNIDDDCLMTIVFKGFEGCRTEIMPWRCLSIHNVSKK